MRSLAAAHPFTVLGTCLGAVLAVINAGGLL